MRFGFRFLVWFRLVLGEKASIEVGEEIGVRGTQWRNGRMVKIKVN